MTYDPEARRDTPMALKLKERIRCEGPISVAEYMRACLHDPEHGYYVRQPAIGAKGDFITAPEISQVFGELIGLWCAVVWQQMCSPGRVNLVEFGPGRGTLISDALRATRIVPGFHEAITLTLVERSMPLATEQKALLRDHGLPILWLDDPRDLPEGPTIVIANEFLDTCPANQIEITDGHWFIRNVGLDDTGRLIFDRETEGFLPDPAVFEQFPQLHPGEIIEGQDFGFYFGLPRAEREPFAALFIDYGHVGFSPGETLQAARAHRPEHPLTSPGEADLTVQVCFGEFIPWVILPSSQNAEGVASECHVVDGPITQAEFLGRLGIIERASRLMAANPAKAGEIETGVARLMAPNGMGTRFKAIGIRSPQLAKLPGFA